MIGSKIFLGGHHAQTFLSASSPDSTARSLLDQGAVFVDRPSEADLFVCIDNELIFMRQLTKLGINKEKCILIRLEPKIVWPLNYVPQIRELYGRVIDVGRRVNFQSSETVTAVRWPQLWPDTKELDLYFANNLRSDSIVLLNANKLSFIDGEMYSLRRACQKQNKSIHLYGSRWNISLFQQMKVFVAEFLIALRFRNLPRIASARHWFRFTSKLILAPENKYETMSGYRYALVIENSLDYMTEKLFDAIFSGCFPIYVGPSLQDFQLPDWLALSVEANVCAIREAIASLEGFDLEGWQQRVRAWIMDEHVKQQWQSNSVFNRIAQEILSFDR